ncbi:MAG: hypothetical protein EOO85_03990 [Pedobacter sp.]|nr:MAG: hypothetical protein EOO85_03990 [Pedobacter sp.]
MPRYIRIALKITGLITLFIIVIWIGGAIYITTNKDAVLKSVLTQLNQNLKGKVSIGSMEPALFKSFPGVSVTLNKVLLRDSLWISHEKDLLNANQVSVSLNIFNLITGKTSINKILIKDAKVCLFTDPTGYSNTSIFRKKTNGSQGDGSASKLEIKNVDFDNVHFIVDNQLKHKLFDFMINKVRGKVKYTSDGSNGSFKINTLVNSFSFNTSRGSFLKDKMLDGTLDFKYDRSKELFTIEPNKLMIGSYAFNIGAKIELDKAAFEIDIATEKILFKDVALLLAPNISSKLLRFTIDEPIAVKGKITETGKEKNIDPLINVAIKVKKSIVNIPSGRLVNATFDGAFTNQTLKHKANPDSLGYLFRLTTITRNINNPNDIYCKLKLVNDGLQSI